MKTCRYQKAIYGIDRRMTKAVRVTCHPKRRYRSFEAMLPVIENKWRMVSRLRFPGYPALWDDMLQEAYIACWRCWEKGQLGRNDAYIAAIVRTACIAVIRQDKAVRGIRASHGQEITVFEYAVSDIIRQDEESNYDDDWIDRQTSPDAPQCPQMGLEQKTRNLYSLNMERALNMALERLSPARREVCIQMAPYLAPSVSQSEVCKLTGLSRNQVHKALRDWRKAACTVMIEH